MDSVTSSLKMVIARNSSDIEKLRFSQICYVAELAQCCRPYLNLRRAQRSKQKVRQRKGRKQQQVQYVDIKNLRKKKTAHLLASIF